MDLRNLAKAVMPPLLYSVVRKAVEGRRSVYPLLDRRPVPWSQGYAEHKQKYIAEAIVADEIVSGFRGDHPLPEKYGYGLDERCIEYPWLLANLAADAKVVLDAGSVLNHAFILTDEFLRKRTLHIMTLAPETNCFWKKGISYLFDDLRAIPIRDEYYDAVVCLSTLEHVGCDNTQYTGASSSREDRSETFRDAVRELRRVLKPDGSLFLSVPYGEYRHYGTFQQFDKALLASAIAAFDETEEKRETFYRYGSAGWQLASAEACEDARYVEWFARAMLEGRSPQPIPVEPDHAAAARAVACVHLVKPKSA
jgi:SAM-dependent methyltransferase